MRISSLQGTAGQDGHQVDRARDAKQGQDGKRGWAKAKFGIGYLRQVLPDCDVINNFSCLPKPECV